MWQQILLALVCSIIGLLPCFLRPWLGGGMYTALPCFRWFCKRDRVEHSRFTESFAVVSFISLAVLFCVEKPDISWHAALALPGYAIAFEWLWTWYIPMTFDYERDPFFLFSRNRKTGIWLLPVIYGSILITYSHGWMKVMWAIVLISSLLLLISAIRKTVVYLEWKFYSLQAKKRADQRRYLRYTE